MADLNRPGLFGDRKGLLPVISIIPLALLLIALISFGISQAAPTADCSNGNFNGYYEVEDVTLSGDLYATGHVTIRNGITMTLEAGANVIMCGAYQISISGGANLQAVGTEASPISFSADDPSLNWNRILISGEANHSILQHVIISDGGGSDPNASAGTVQIGSNLAANSMPSPTLDQVMISDSGAFGLYIQVNSDDVTPPSITNVTIKNSASGAVLANAQALGGLGSGNVYINNNPNTIQVIGGGNSTLYQSQIWRSQTVPYEVLGSLLVAAASSGDPYPTLTIEEGVTFLMHPGARFVVGTSAGRGGSIVVDGTADAPVTFTRLDDVGGPWHSLSLNLLYPDTRADLQHVTLNFGGSGGTAAIHQVGSGSLTLDDVSIQNSPSTGLSASGIVNIRDSLFEFNETGLEFSTSADVVVRNSVIRNNVTAGLVSLDAGFDDNCIDAVGNFWDSPDGPVDVYDKADFCGNANSNASSGDSVSGGILYHPWLPGDGPLLDRGIIAPDQFYVVADGIDETQVTITLRDAQGGPLAGKEVELKATVGTVVQPKSKTDADGVTTAVISSTIPGFAYLSAYNLTDDTPIAGLGGVTFWQGSGDTGGLIDPGGAPFASTTQLKLIGKPFQAGFPMSMRLPVQNSNPYPVDVQVVYGISNLAVGSRFAPVYTATTTLQPGDSWNAEGIWLPTVTGTHCVQAVITTSGEPAISPQIGQEATSSTQRHAINSVENPCDKETLNVMNLVPKIPGGLIAVAKQFGKSYNEAKKANKCISDSLSFFNIANRGIFNTDRDYQQVVLPTIFNPPPISAGDGITPDQANALNSLAQTAADLLSLNLAIGATAQRMNWAAQAAGIAGSDLSSSSAVVQRAMLNANNDLYYLDLQFQAYRDFINQYADKLDEYADEIDTLLLAQEGEDETYFLPEDFQSTRNELANNGFDDEERSYHEQTGLSADLIAELEQDLVAAYDSYPAEPISFREILISIQDNMQDLATELRGKYPSPESVQQLSASQEPGIYVEPQVYTFEVGHPFSGQATVELVVRPVSIPLGWTYELSGNSFTLGEGETVEAALTLYPDGNALERDLIQVTVEGTVNGELVGGILMQYHAPSLTPQSSNVIYLPMIAN